MVPRIAPSIMTMIPVTTTAMVSGETSSTTWLLSIKKQLRTCNNNKLRMKKRGRKVTKSCIFCETNLSKKHMFLLLFPAFFLQNPRLGAPHVQHKHGPTRQEDVQKVADLKCSPAQCMTNDQWWLWWWLCSDFLEKDLFEKLHPSRWKTPWLEEGD